jgi:hypothetical protein
MTMFVGAAAAGALIWFAGRFDALTSHDYWISLGLIAAAGLVLGLALRSYEAQAAGLVVALVVLAVAIWVALATQPTGGHVANWSHSLGIGGVVHDLGVHVAVLAMGAGVVVATAVGLTRRSPAETPVVEREVAPAVPAEERLTGQPGPELHAAP